MTGDAAFSAVVAEKTAVVPEVAAYRPGEFYLRELPPLRAVLRGVGELGLLVVDSYADLDPSGRPGLGAHAHAEFGVPVIGVAKSPFPAATHAIPVLRAPLRARCSSPPPACPALTQLIWSGTWLAGSGYPMPCAAPTRWRAPGRKQAPRPATARSDKARIRQMRTFPRGNAPRSCAAFPRNARGVCRCMASPESGGPMDSSGRRQKRMFALLYLCCV